MKAITPGWRFVSDGVEWTPVRIGSVDPWKHEWESGGGAIEYCDPQDPSRRHLAGIYDIRLADRGVRFASNEHQNGRWIFFEPI